MRREALAAFLLFSGRSACAAQGAPFMARFDFGRLFTAPATMASLYGGNAALVSRYVVAMRHYRNMGQRGEDVRLAIAFAPRDADYPGEPWTWTADSGDFVRRVSDGLFRIGTGSVLDNWFFEFDCRLVKWPNFTCDDGRDRVMSAPDLSTLVLDGVTYRRPYPKAAVPPLQEDPGSD